jgi:aminoglycoside phosphotransferase (APT) family kinase protein
MLFVLEDLDAAGFGIRRSRVSEAELQACLRWLASFHATFLGEQPESLWKVGSYWHLATRPDELGALGDRALQRAAPKLDERLNRARFRTLVHGDAKLQNFCFAADASAVAAVDFQYVGGGVGVKDLAYFLSSALPAAQLEREADGYVDDYFRELRRALEGRKLGSDGGMPSPDFAPLEAEWRELYPFACADFYRFLLGWAGDDAGRDRYLEGVTRALLVQG